MVVVVHRIFSPAYKCDAAVGLLLCSVYEMKRNSRMITGTVNYGNLLIDGRESVQTVPQHCCGTGLTRIPVTLTVWYFLVPYPIFTLPEISLKYAYSHL